MRKLVSGILIGLAVAAFSWWLQAKAPELHWTATNTQVDPLAATDSPYRGLQIFSLNVTNNGDETARAVTIEVELDEGEFRTANIDVPEKTAVGHWTELPADGPTTKRVALQYTRLLPGDSIQIAALLGNSRRARPAVTVRSETAAGIPNEVVEDRRKRRTKLIFIAFNLIMFGWLIVSLLAIRHQFDWVLRIGMVTFPLFSLLLGADLRRTGRALLYMKRDQHSRAAAQPRSSPPITLHRRIRHVPARALLFTNGGHRKAKRCAGAMALAPPDRVLRRGR